MKELAKKLVLAVKAIDAVEKRGKNEKQGYAYVKATDVASVVRTVLADHGVAFTYDCIETERWEKQTNAGGLLFFVQLKIAVTFTDQETGDSITAGGFGWGMDSGDKAIYKAMTGALKYALRMNFLIPDELDPENDTGHAEPSDRKEVVRQTVAMKANGNGHSKPLGENDATGDAAISEGKAKRFWAIALSTNKSKDEIGEALAAEGLSDIKHCPWKGNTYINLVKWAER